MDKGNHNILFRHEADPETGEQFMELHIKSRLGMGVAITEKLLKNLMIPAAEEADPEGLAIARKIHGMTEDSAA